MKQPVDSFFNKKLKNHSAEAPTSAWDRIDANLSQKKKPLVWLKIAAGLLLLMVAGSIIYTTVRQPIVQVAEVKETTPVEMGIASPEIVPPVEPVKTQEAVLPQTAITETTVVKHPKKKIKIPQTETPDVVAVVEATVTPAITLAENLIAPAHKPKENPSETEIQNTTILISVEEANAKYLNEQFIADATTENKKPSKLRNLFEKAQEMDPIGEIRQLKNEVLALNFRNEKKGERNR